MLPAQSKRRNCRRRSLPPPDRRTIASAKTAISPATDATVAIDKADDGGYRLAPDSPTIATSTGKGPAQRTALGTQAGKATGSGSGHGTDATPPPAVGAAETPVPKATRFVTVDSRELHGKKERDDEALWQWIGIGTLCAAAILLIGGVAYYATRSPSANQLFATIQQAAQADNLGSAESQLAEFLASHAADPRAAEVQQYQAELERNRLQQSFERRIRHADGPEGLTPVERAYYEAAQLAILDPHTACRGSRRFSPSMEAPPTASPIRQTLATLSIVWNWPSSRSSVSAPRLKR